MKSLIELKNELQQRRSLDDLVEAIIFKVSSKDRHTIPKQQGFLQTEFFKLKAQKPELFSELIFDESGITPFSEQLDSALFRLESSAILSTLNPSYKNYILVNSKEHMREAYEKFPESMRCEIDSCAELFAKSIS